MITLTVLDQGQEVGNITKVFKPPRAVFYYTTKTNRVIFHSELSFAADGKQIISFEWDFGDESSLLTFDNEPVSHLYPTLGSWTVNLRVVDTDGLSNSFSLMVHSPTNLLAEVALFYELLEDQNLTQFTTKGSMDPDGTILSYLATEVIS